MSDPLLLDLVTIGAAALTTLAVGGLWMKLVNRSVDRANARWAPFRGAAPLARPVPRMDPDVPPGARPHWDGDLARQ